MSTILSFKSIENKHDVYRCKNHIKMFRKFLREREKDIINFKKKKYEVINKQTVEIISKFKNLLHF